MEHLETLGKIENLLFAAGDAMQINELADVLEMDIDLLYQIIDEEALRRKMGYGLEIRRFGDRIQLSTKKEYASLIFNALGEAQKEELSRATLETISIIAYRQPVTRGEIEAIRGVSSGYVVRALLDRGLIYESGKKKTIGRPALFCTTDAFLRHFGMETLDDLPLLQENNEPQEVLLT